MRRESASALISVLRPPGQSGPAGRWRREKERRRDELLDRRAVHGRPHDVGQDDRLFPFTKHYFRREMLKASEAARVERIRLHDLRHSHASLLIHLGCPVLLVSERLGHEDVQTTLRIYGHLYPSTVPEAVKKLDDLMP